MQKINWYKKQWSVRATSTWGKYGVWCFCSSCMLCKQREQNKNNGECISNIGNRWPESTSSSRRPQNGSCQPGLDRSGECCLFRINFYELLIWTKHFECGLLAVGKVKRSRFSILSLRWGCTPIERLLFFHFDFSQQSRVAVCFSFA